MRQLQGAGGADGERGVPHCARLVAAALAVDAVVGQMDEAVPEALFVIAVRLRGEPTKPLLVHVYPAAPGEQQRLVSGLQALS